MNPFLAGRRPPGTPVFVMGHRGCANAPENTLEAFDYAIQQGADIIEFDVRERLLVSHDPPSLAALAAAQVVKRLRRTHPVRRRALCSVRDALLFLKAKNVYANIEIKISDAARDVVKLVERLDMVDRVLISSFLHDQVWLEKRLNPRIAGSVLTRARLMDAARYVRKVVGADWYAPRRDAFEPVRGLNIYVWTVNSPKEMRALIAGGAKGICTDYPSRLRRVVDSVAAVGTV